MVDETKCLYNGLIKQHQTKRKIDEMIIHLSEHEKHFLDKKSFFLLEKLLVKKAVVFEMPSKSFPIIFCAK